jgi:hypothetical protein
MTQERGARPFEIGRVPIYLIITASNGNVFGVGTRTLKIDEPVKIEKNGKSGRK